MLVRLRANWFGPGETIISDGRRMSGKLFRKGDQEIPDSLRDFLPSSAEILSGDMEKHIEEVVDLKEMDEDRAVAEAEGKMEAQADDSLAKARAALARKRAQQRARKQEENG